MVGRFNVRPGDGVDDWSVWDNATNGRRGLSQAQASEVAADLELQYSVHGARDQSDVRRVSPPVPVDAWQRAGVLDAWVRGKAAGWAGCGCLTAGFRGSTMASSAPRPPANLRRPTTGRRPANARSAS